MSNFTPDELEALMPGAREMEELRQELLAEGNTEEEVKQYMADLRTIGFEQETLRLMGAGHDPTWIENLWLAIEDALPKDDPDNDDREYGATV